MTYAILFSFAGIVLAWEAIQSRGLGLFLLWPAVALLVVAIGYAGVGPIIFGKRPDGTMRFASIALLLPYLLPTWLLWHVRRSLDRGAVGQQVAPGLWLCRRPYLREMPAGITLVCDLTAEFPADRALAHQVSYCCLPVMDAATTSDAAFLDALHRVCRATGPVYIHCALGHGRSAALMCAVLIAKGIVPDVDSAESLLQKSRPEVRINRRQREQVTRIGRMF